MIEIVTTLAASGAFILAILAFLPSKQLDLRPVRVRREQPRRASRADLPR